MLRRRHFPDPETADRQGLVARTPGLSTELLFEAYSRGIFPWSSDPVRWYSPEPRAVFLRPYIQLPRKIGKMMRRAGFRVTFDTAFGEVIQACSDAHRDEGEWISADFVRAYVEFNAAGWAHSIEVWQGEQLVGGLYGVQIGGMFAGESMFHRVSNASKVAFAYLVEQLHRLGVLLIDAQVLNQHTLDLGAVLVHRHDFLLMLERALEMPVKSSGEKWPAEPEFDLSMPGVTAEPWPASGS